MTRDPSKDPRVRRADKRRVQAEKVVERKRAAMQAAVDAYANAVALAALEHARWERAYDDAATDQAPEPWMPEAYR